MLASACAVWAGAHSTSRQQHHPFCHICRCSAALQGDRRAPELQGLSLLGVTQIDRVVEAVEETLKGHTVQLLAKKALPRLDLPKVCRSPCWEVFGGLTERRGNKLRCWGMQGQ